MAGNSLFYAVFSLFLLCCVFLAGCSDEPAPADTVTATPVHPDPKYTEGDIIATVSSSSASSLYLILKYDAATDQYTRAVIEKNADGQWGHRVSDRTEKSSRTALEKVYTVKAGHVAVSIVPVITPSTEPETTVNPSGNAPAIIRVSPTFASRDSVVSVAITGENFQNGATVKLYKAGALPITATVVSVTSFDIACNFNLYGKGDGDYNLIVINPDGKSDSRQGIFTIGEASPVIAGMYPVTGAVNEKVPVTINGQNFRNDVKVTFTRNSTELVCDRPLSMESSKITCTLDLGASRGASAGEWSVTVLNIRDQRKGTWVKKFVITNATTGTD